ncbi:MAG: hypothetical protein Q7S22_07045 [Candidatus Micrarchaeota archaeon]|nr:hypothetical protein [Candidatus Micrarchaeota archaeon]
MGSVQVDCRKVEVVNKQTYLEAIHRSNMLGKRIISNSSFNELFFGRNSQGRLKPISDRIYDVRPWYTGTVGVVGAKGKPLGTTVESQSQYAGTVKTVIVRPGKRDADLVDTMVLSDHGFTPDGTPLLSLSNAKTGKSIRNDEEMGEADEVLLRLNGQKRRFKINDRTDGLFEAVGDVNTFSWISDSAAIGLLERNTFGGSLQLVSLGTAFWCCLGVVRETASVNVPIATSHSLPKRQLRSNAPLETASQ